MNEKKSSTDATNTIRVLLVDDEAAFRVAVVKRLTRRGVHAEHTESGEKCLRYLGNFPFDIVLLDYNLPGMSGIDTLKEIKSLYPKTEVILLTGQANATDGAEWVKAGAFDYMAKPMEIEDLMDKIKQAYEKIRLTS